MENFKSYCVLKCKLE